MSNGVFVGFNQVQMICFFFFFSSIFWVILGTLRMAKKYDNWKKIWIKMQNFRQCAINKADVKYPEKSK